MINLCSLAGAFVLPCLKLQSYKIILMFMVGIAVGALCGSSMLFLIPGVSQTMRGFSTIAYLHLDLCYTIEALIEEQVE